MGRWRTLGGELSALGALALSLPLGRLLPRERFDPAARLDCQRRAPRLGQMIARVCRETGSPRVDVVGHSAPCAPAAWAA